MIPQIPSSPSLILLCVFSSCVLFFFFLLLSPMFSFGCQSQLDVFKLKWKKRDLACPPPCRPEEVTTELRTTGVGYPSHRRSLSFLVWYVHLLRLLQKQDLVVQACPQFVFSQSKTLFKDSNGLREENQQLKLCSHFMAKKGPLFIFNSVAKHSSHRNHFQCS